MNQPTCHRPLQLLNPTAKPYVALTPTLVSPHEHQSINLRLDHSTTTARYYDEDDPSKDSHVIDLNNSLHRLAPPTSPSLDPIQLFNQHTHHWQHFSERRPLLAFSVRLLLVLLSSALLLAALVWFLLPPLDPKDLATLRIPTSFDALKKLNALLQIYKTENYYRVLSSFVLIYLFLQAFSLPGSMYLSILAGAMFGVQVALPLVSLCVGTGAMLCYLMSLNLASSLVIHSPCLRSRLDDWKIKLSTKTNRFDLFSYLVVIRISPLPPHWVVNLLAPHVGIQLGLFWLTTCIGILPVTLIHTQLGTTLDQMVGPEDLSFLTTKNLTGLSLVAIGVMTPVIIRWYLKKDLQDVCSHHPTTTVESRRPIALRLESSTNLDHQDVPSTTPRRSNHRLRNFSSQTLENLLNTATANSSYSSLNKLNSLDSTETLLLSSHHHHHHTSQSPTCYPKSSSHHPHQPQQSFFSKSLVRKNNHQVLINHDEEEEDKALLLETSTKMEHPGRLPHQFSRLVWEQDEDPEDDSIEEIRFKRSLNFQTPSHPRHHSQKHHHHHLVHP